MHRERSPARRSRNTWVEWSKRLYTRLARRYKKLTDAQTAFHEQVAKLHYSLSEEMAELIKKYVGLTSWGHDRMRKGDASFLVKARDTEQQIKELCPWDK